MATVSLGLLQGCHLKSTTPSHSSACSLYSRSQSQDKHLLLEPAVSTVTGSRVFSYVASSILNKLPLESRTSSSFASFKRNRKTYYFFTCLPLDPPRHLSPSDCLCLRFGPAADNAHVTHDFIVLYCKANLVAQLQHAIWMSFLMEKQKSHSTANTWHEQPNTFTYNFPVLFNQTFQSYSKLAIHKGCLLERAERKSNIGSSPRVC